MDVNTSQQRQLQTVHTSIHSPLTIESMHLYVNSYQLYMTHSVFGKKGLSLSLSLSWWHDNKYVYRLIAAKHSLSYIVRELCCNYNNVRTLFVCTCKHQWMGALTFISTCVDSCRASCTRAHYNQKPWCQLSMQGSITTNQCTSFL